MSFINKDDNKPVVDITGSKANALSIASYIGQIIGRDEAIKFVTSNCYLTSVAKLSYLFQGIDIIHDLSEEQIAEVKKIMVDFSEEDKAQIDRKKSLDILTQEDAFTPILI